MCFRLSTSFHFTEDDVENVYRCRHILPFPHVWTHFIECFTEKPLQNMMLVVPGVFMVPGVVNYNFQTGHVTLATSGRHMVYFSDVYSCSCSYSGVSLFTYPTTVRQCFSASLLSFPANRIYTSGKSMEEEPLARGRWFVGRGMLLVSLFVAIPADSCTDERS